MAHARAGQPALPEDLIDVEAVRAAYHSVAPDPGDPDRSGQIGPHIGRAVEAPPHAVAVAQKQSAGGMFDGAFEAVGEGVSHVNVGDRVIYFANPPGAYATHRVMDARPLVTQLLPSGPDLFDDTLYSLLLTAAFHAERRLLAATPYFVPDEALMTALMMAARRGVQISLLIPAHSNHRLADVARMRALRQLAQVGAHIHLYPRMLHAKVVVIDEAMALAGSLNLDSRSFFLNYEMMVAFYRKTEVRWLSDWLEAHLADMALWGRRGWAIVQLAQKRCPPAAAGGG